jgi:hypothetical protein
MSHIYRAIIKPILEILHESFSCMLIVKIKGSKGAVDLKFIKASRIY